MKTVNNRAKYALVTSGCIGLLMSSLPTQAAFEANVKNACPQRWEMVLKDGLPKVKHGSGYLGPNFAIDKIWSTSNVWAITHYFSFSKMKKSPDKLNLEDARKTTSSNTLPSIVRGYPVPVTNIHLLNLAVDDRRRKSEYIFTSADETRWNKALTERGKDMTALLNHIKAARVTQTIDPAELYDLVFDELTVASECVRYRNMMTDTAGYKAPTSTPNYSYGWLPAVF